MEVNVYLRVCHLRLERVDNSFQRGLQGIFLSRVVSRAAGCGLKNKNK
jgi:hypothetical protein